MIVSIMLAVGLAASCGFRVFVPMLVIGVAARSSDLITLSAGFDWLASTPAITCFAIATVLEIVAYYVPWLDNLLDSISTPAAVVAGVIVTAACVSDMHPMMKWSLAIIAGGGTAGTIKGGLSALRLGSTTTTGGAANPVVSTVEWISSAALSVLAIFFAPLAALIAIILVIVLVRFAWKLWSYLRRKPEAKVIAESEA